MFTLTEAGYRLFRNRSRSLLLALVSLLLCGCIAFYIGNILSSQKALDRINETNPAVGAICCQDGSRTKELTIAAYRVDLLEDWGMTKVLAATQASGALGEEAKRQNPYNGGDTAMLAVSCLEAASPTPEDRFTYGEGYDESLLAGSEALCLLSESYAAEHGFAVGDTLTMPIHMTNYTGSGAITPVYIDIGEQTLTVAGTFVQGLETKAEDKTDALLPVKWLRAASEAYGEAFSYNNCEFYLKDSMLLNDFKEAAPGMGFSQPFAIQSFSEWAMPPSKTAGVAIFMNDEDFIKTAEKLGGSIRQFKAMLLPFFLVVTLLVTLAIFLVLRSTRREMAIASSLGRSKVLTGAASLLAALASEAAGCVAGIPLMLLLAGLPVLAVAAICGAFLLCALLGDLIGLAALLRFDTLNLLTAAE